MKHQQTRQERARRWRLLGTACVALSGAGAAARADEKDRSSTTAETTARSTTTAPTVETSPSPSISTTTAPAVATTTTAATTTTTTAAAGTIGPLDLAGRLLVDDELGSRRGGTAHNDMRLDGVVGANEATNVVTGANTISSGAFAGTAGLPMVIQNSGNNVLIQNATIVNVQIK